MPKLNRTPIIISIEGNIGSGKSTFVEHLQQSYDGTPCNKRKNFSVCFLQEPVDDWHSITDKKGETMLSKFYADSKKYAFPFQMMAYISRLALLRDALKTGYDIIITERCVQTDKMVFAQMLYDDGKMEDVEYAIYNKWFDEFISDIPEIFTIYLRTDPEVAKKRVEKRARDGETIPLEYLTACHEYHERWLTSKPEHTIKTIDVNADTEANAEMISCWADSVKEVIAELQLMTNRANDSPDTHILMFDGGSRGNPGICGAGHVIMFDGKQISSGSAIVATNNTNNYAEYMSLINGMNDASDHGIKDIIVKGDSLLVINQVIGKWKIRSAPLQNLHAEVIDKLSQFDTISFHHVPREENKLADAEANKAMDNYVKAVDDI
jgi:deoxyadenosine/deoxycytidine kinase/ribonuclease HI